MTTLYRPVLIESAEQAEALPIGTVATDLGSTITSAAVRTDVGLGWFVSGDEMTDMHEHLVGWTALVPIEAEEEFTAMGTDDGEHWIAHVGTDGITGSREDAEQYTKRFGGFIARRYRTPWEEA